MSSEPARLETRRRVLPTRDNPDSRQDYISQLDATLQDAFASGPVSLCLRYVPDRHVLSAEGLDRYLASLDQEYWETLEDLALAVLDDLNNEIVPRWVQVRLTTGGHGRCDRHQVTLCDRQPNWDNDQLLRDVKPA